MTAKGPVEKKDGRIEQAELTFSLTEQVDARRGEIVRGLNDNLQAKQEMARVLTTMGFSQEAAARLLRLNPEGGEKEKN